MVDPGLAVIEDNMPPIDKMAPRRALKQKEALGGLPRALRAGPFLGQRREPLFSGLSSSESAVQAKRLGSSHALHS